MEEISGQDCPFCKTKNLTLCEDEKEVPYFGKVFLFSMTCSHCKYHKADIECAEARPPVTWELEINCEEDMNIRIVRSANATVKIPRITTITPGPGSNGYITNVESILNRIKRQIEYARDEEEDPATKKKAKNLLKKLQDVMWGRDSIKLIIKDPSGNSAIISEKAKKSKL
ncbi:MAG: ZPR1 zinc finger domain-containing protein [Candidatus Nanoarchaeia archaeon]